MMNDNTAGIQLLEFLGLVALLITFALLIA